MLPRGRLAALQTGVDAIDYATLAAQLGVSTRTVRRDVAALEGAGKVHINGRVEVRA